ncbi:hypothetical protein M427DRAFT_74996 [Gonapodya prolifera JEL478]|uniref:Uncharacterized protein n=1 Tax=Gonapodya prolifera (strain JEL478) TaxID=1344416 RepID=A0A138ZZ17_GONPJ|nr:hypothetical protein M427DRAFT_74996 [Gonapodya prolifera JEL478]|eukprot:KXS09740.1 hypothetical protein M427DRAFT_74996 [Gonapodya prolifera JEL478]
MAREFSTPILIVALALIALLPLLTERGEALPTSSPQLKKRAPFPGDASKLPLCPGNKIGLYQASPNGFWTTPDGKEVLSYQNLVQYRNPDGTLGWGWTGKWQECAGCKGDWAIAPVIYGELPKFCGVSRQGQEALPRSHLSHSLRNMQHPSAVAASTRTRHISASLILAAAGTLLHLIPDAHAQPQPGTATPFEPPILSPVRLIALASVTAVLVTLAVTGAIITCLRRRRRNAQGKPEMTMNEHQSLTSVTVARQHVLGGGRSLSIQRISRTHGNSPLGPHGMTRSATAPGSLLSSLTPLRGAWGSSTLPARPRRARLASASAVAAQRSPSQSPSLPIQAANNPSLKQESSFNTIHWHSPSITSIADAPHQPASLPPLAATAASTHPDPDPSFSPESHSHSRQLTLAPTGSSHSSNPSWRPWGHRRSSSLASLASTPSASTAINYPFAGTAPSAEPPHAAGAAAAVPLPPPIPAPLWYSPHPPRSSESLGSLYSSGGSGGESPTIGPRSSTGSSGGLAVQGAGRAGGGMRLWTPVADPRGSWEGRGV